MWYVVTNLWLKFFYYFLFAEPHEVHKEYVVTNKKKKWPDNDSEYAADWEFDKMRNWATIRLIEAFVMEGSRGVRVEMHGIITTAFQWRDNQEAAKKHGN